MGAVACSQARAEHSTKWARIMSLACHSAVTAAGGNSGGPCCTGKLTAYAITRARGSLGDEVHGARHMSLMGVVYYL